MADSHLNALFAATLRTKVRPLVPVPDDAQEWGDKIAITDAGVRVRPLVPPWRAPLFEGYALVPISAAQMQDLVDEGAEPDSHDEWRKLNARPAG